MNHTLTRVWFLLPTTLPFLNTSFIAYDSLDPPLGASTPTPPRPTPSGEGEGAPHAPLWALVVKGVLLGAVVLLTIGGNLLVLVR